MRSTSDYRASAIALKALIFSLLLSPLLVAGELKTDIEYAQAGATRMLMDVYVPDGRGTFPAVIWVHGGGFVHGDKRPYPHNLFDPLVKNGFAWVSVNYRLAPAATFPAQSDDIEHALAYVIDHAGEYKIDRRQIVLMGASAGAQLVSLVGAKHRPEQRVAAVVCFFGSQDLLAAVHPAGSCVMDGRIVSDPGPACLSPGLSAYLRLTANSPSLDETLRRASPITYVHEGMPPYLFLHGTQDLNASFEQSVRMCQAMTTAGAKCEVVRIEGGAHGFVGWGGVNYQARMIEWLKSVL